MKTAHVLSENLRAAGHRLTKARSALLDIFLAAASPLSAPQLIAELGKRKLPVNKTTVYRELEFLMSQGIIRQIDLLDGRKHYELSSGGAHHHHLVCNRCGTVQCIDLPRGLDRITSAIKRTHAFEVTSHVLEFFGLCQRCSRPQRPKTK
ncbi:MAG: transcriptional repressor [Bdellovibrionota bacterium]|nr:MAG: transcriptional repressor [Bdellovibrionota bacterium]